MALTDSKIRAAITLLKSNKKPTMLWSVAPLCGKNSASAGSEPDVRADDSSDVLDYAVSGKSC